MACFVLKTTRLNILQQRQLPGTFRPNRIAAVLQLVLFLFVLAMATSESLHRALHHDADEPNHQCAVTMLHAGQVNAPTADAPIIRPQPITSALPVIESFFVASEVFYLPPSCGPPALLA
jgi:hypothetical protein